MNIEPPSFQTAQYYLRQSLTQLQQNQYTLASESAAKALEIAINSSESAEEPNLIEYYAQYAETLFSKISQEDEICQTTNEDIDLQRPLIQNKTPISYIEEEAMLECLERAKKIARSMIRYTSISKREKYNDWIAEISLKEAEIYSFYHYYDTAIAKLKIAEEIRLQEGLTASLAEIYLIKAKYYGLIPGKKLTSFKNLLLSKKLYLDIISINNSDDHQSKVSHITDLINSVSSELENT